MPRIKRNGESSELVTDPQRRRALASDAAGMVAIVRQGVKSDIYGWLRQALAVSDSRLSAIIRVSQRTIKRRLGDGRFHPDESERLMRVVKLTERACEVFGDLESAREWLKSPQFALGGEIPLEYADTEPGAQVVEDALGRLEQGIPT